MKKFNGEVRVTKVLDDTELRAALQGGWLKELPAIEDEYGSLLVGHRRMKIAQEAGIKPVIKIVTFGDGPEAEAARIRLANVSNIGGAPMTKDDRKRQAERLYKSGLTQTAIAHMLGVSQWTISQDLKTLEGASKVSDKPRIDRLGRKNTGRPKSNISKSTRKPGEKQHQRSINAKPEDWEVFKQKAEAEGKSAAEKLGELIAAPVIERAELSMTAQQKLDTALRQYKAKLDVDFFKRVNERVEQFLEETILPTHRKEQAQYEQIVRARKGILDKATFKLIWSALHPDSRHSISDKKLADAFDKFSALEKLLLNEKDSPTEFQVIPTNWDELKRRAAEARKTKRATRSSGREMAR